MKRSGGTRYMYLSALITVSAALTACTPKTSLEQHTRHYVYASDDGFDPNFYTNHGSLAAANRGVAEYELSE